MPAGIEHLFEGGCVATMQITSEEGSTADAPALRARFGGLSPREAAERSHEVRRRKAELSPEERAAEAARTAAPELIKELLDAALGKGDFVGLKGEDRLKALTRALEYGIGRPGVMRREDGTPTPIPSAADLFGPAASAEEEDLD
jgi:hypothetical protein